MTKAGKEHLLLQQGHQQADLQLMPGQHRHQQKRCCTRRTAETCELRTWPTARASQLGWRGASGGNLGS